MRQRFLGVRWWLGAAFALVAAVSTAIVVSQYSSRSESALRVNAEQQAIASAFDAATDLGGAPATDATVVAAARRQGLQLAVYDNRGHLRAGHASTLDRLALGPAPRAQRYHGSTANGGTFIVGMPFQGGAPVPRDVRP